MNTYSIGAFMIIKMSTRVFIDNNNLFSGTFKTTHLSLPIDILIEVEETLPVPKLSNVLSRAVSRQIAALFECLSVYTQVR